MSRSHCSTVEELEDFWQILHGPMGDALREAGVIMARRLDERRQTFADLDDMQVMHLFQSAFLEAAPKAYPNRDGADVDSAVNLAFSGAAIELLANAARSDTVN